jgi:ribokinase
MIGTGGIGSGIFFALDGAHTLGREESRSGHFLDRRDYCKLHIVSHYVQALLGPEFATIPVGKVGRDEVGTRLLEEMRDAGLDLRYVEQAPDRPTLFAVCFIYPDGSGGNLTANDSACAAVDQASVERAESEFERCLGRGVALALPEVPLAARRAVLELGRRYRFLGAASYSSAEIGPAMRDGDLDRVDLLALNLDEAAAAAGTSPEGRQPGDLAEAAVRSLSALHRGIRLTITAGRQGSWSWDGTDLAHLPALHVPVVSTAGAGDAHLAGTIAGLAAGMPLARAHELGVLTAAMSVTSPHTINKEVTRSALRRFAGECGATVSEVVMEFLMAMDEGR